VKHQVNYIHVIPGPKASEDQTCEHPTKLENALADLHRHALHIAWRGVETVLKITVARLYFIVLYFYFGSIKSSTCQ